MFLIRRENDASSGEGGLFTRSIGRTNLQRPNYSFRGIANYKAHERYTKFCRLILSVDIYVDFVVRYAYIYFDIFVFRPVDKEHNRCKYPSWITEHHDWRSLDGTKVYHFTNKNATLKVKVQNADGDTFHEEKIVCHNLEKLHPPTSENTQGYKVKLIAHVTSGW